VKRSNILRASRKRIGYVSDTTGTRISIAGGKPFFASVSFPSISDSLETGGFNIATSLTAVWPIGRAAKPVKGAVLKLEDENVTFRIEHSVSNIGDPVNPSITVQALRD
jgi:hypothetical protein